METNRIFGQAVVSNLKSKAIKRSFLTLFLIVFSIATYSQNSPRTNENKNTPNTSGVITLQNLVDRIKSENESLQNLKAVNVMVDDMLIKNPKEFMINPNNIETQEILVLNPNDALSGKTIASIIIDTRGR